MLLDGVPAFEIVSQSDDEVVVISGATTHTNGTNWVSVLSQSEGSQCGPSLTVARGTHSFAFSSASPFYSYLSLSLSVCRVQVSFCAQAPTMGPLAGDQLVTISSQPGWLSWDDDDTITVQFGAFTQDVVSFNRTHVVVRTVSGMPGAQSITVNSTALGMSEIFAVMYTYSLRTLLPFLVFFFSL